ncbi:MAG: hypothetical protein AAGF12_00790 [Myxococcota bacterium]
MTRSFPAFLLVLTACGSTELPATTSEPAPEEDRGEPTTGEPDVPTVPRLLGADGTFADLVAATQLLDDRGEAESEAACLLSGTGALDPFRLEADVALAVRPVPPPGTGLAERLRGDDLRVRLLTRWGQFGAELTGVSAVALTSTPPESGQAALLAITSSGLVLRPVGGTALPGGTPEELLATPGDVHIYVTADADVSLAELRRVLGLAGDGAVLALAVVFPEDTTLPAPPEGVLGAPLCEELPPRSGATGSLPPEAIVGALEGMHAQAARCLSSTRAARGGVVQLSFRIGADGRVSDACVPVDEIGSPPLRACVLAALREVRFPSPEPAGFVEVALPLHLEPSFPPIQRPLCAR